MPEPVFDVLVTGGGLAAGAHLAMLTLRAWSGRWLRAAGLALGIAVLALAVSGPALACLSPARLEGLRLPVLPTTPERPAVHVVDAGESLWSVAADRLPPQASSKAVARSWHRWYAANRAVIGPDPSVLVPGQRLMPPVPPHLRRHPS